jgi:hypothetical protein
MPPQPAQLAEANSPPGHDHSPEMITTHSSPEQPVRSAEATATPPSAVPSACSTAPSVGGNRDGQAPATEGGKYPHDAQAHRVGQRGLVPAHHIAGLLSSDGVSQERGRVSEPVVNAVSVTSEAAFVSGDWRGADGACDAISPYWVTEVSPSPGNEGCGQPLHSLLVEHAYADTNRRSSSPTVVRSSIR